MTRQGCVMSCQNWCYAWYLQRLVFLWFFSTQHKG